MPHLFGSSILKSHSQTSTAEEQILATTLSPFTTTTRTMLNGTYQLAFCILISHFCNLPLAQRRSSECGPSSVTRLTRMYHPAPLDLKSSSHSSNVLPLTRSRTLLDISGFYFLFPCLSLLKIRQEKDYSYIHIAPLWYYENDPSNNRRSCKCPAHSSPPSRQSPLLYISLSQGLFYGSCLVNLGY